MFIITTELRRIVTVWLKLYTEPNNKIDMTTWFGFYDKLYVFYRTITKLSFHGCTSPIHHRVITFFLQAQPLKYIRRSKTQHFQPPNTNLKQINKTKIDNSVCSKNYL